MKCTTFRAVLAAICVAAVQSAAVSSEVDGGGSTGTDEEYVRGVSPEGRVKIDGMDVQIGGMEGQPILNYIREE